MKRKTVVRLSSWILCMVMTLFVFAGAAYAKGEGSKPVTMDDLEIIATEMEADGVYNTGGFGGLLKMKYNETVEAYEPSTACALINRKGESIFPYTETGYQYYVYGDYISLAYKDAFTLSAIGQKSPKYYRISGDKIEELATNLYTGTPMINGYAVGYDKREDMWQGGNAHMADAKNQTVYSYPEAFNTLIGYGGGPSLSAFYSENSIACISDGVIGCYVRGQFGSLVSAFYMDYQGNKIIELPNVTGISAFSEGRAAVRKSNLWGYIDTEGQMVVDCQYSAAGDFCDGMAYVRATTGKFGYINPSGEVVIPLEYDDAKGAGNGLAAVGKEKKYGLVNYQNEVVVPLEYDDISSFVDGVAYAVKDGKVYIIRMKEEPAPKLFDDVQNPNAWYYETVYKIANTLNANGKPLMSGYGNGNKFGPADPLTRQDFAVILYRLADEPEVEPMANPFKDTKENGYYYTCVVWAKANEVIAGYNDGRFGVGDKITREQVATILYRFAKDYLHVNTNEALGKGDLKKFEDGTAISSWAKEALTWATGAGVITGKANGTKIDARGNAARAEIGAMILRFITYMDNAPHNSSSVN